MPPFVPPQVAAAPFKFDGLAMIKSQVRLPIVADAR